MLDVSTPIVEERPLSPKASGLSPGMKTSGSPNRMKPLASPGPTPPGSPLGHKRCRSPPSRTSYMSPACLTSDILLAQVRDDVFQLAPDTVVAEDAALRLFCLTESPLVDNPTSKADHQANALNSRISIAPLCLPTITQTLGDSCSSLSPGATPDLGWSTPSPGPYTPSLVTPQMFPTTASNLGTGCLTTVSSSSEVSPAVFSFAFFRPPGPRVPSTPPSDQSSPSVTPVKRARSRHRGPNVMYSRRQVELLSEVFAKTPFPCRDQRHQVSELTGLSHANIQNWFKNARRREKRLFFLRETRDASSDASLTPSPPTSASDTERTERFFN